MQQRANEVLKVGSVWPRQGEGRDLKAAEIKVFHLSH